MMQTINNNDVSNKLTSLLNHPIISTIVNYVGIELTKFVKSMITSIIQTMRVIAFCM